MALYFEQNSKQWGKFLAIGFAMYFLIILASFFRVSEEVRNAPSGGMVSVVFGPFRFVDIQKTAHVGGGYELDFALKVGLLLFLLCICGAAITVASLRRNASR